MSQLGRKIRSNYFYKSKKKSRCRMRKNKNEKGKFGLKKTRSRMKYELKTIEKKIGSKKIEKLPHANKKIVSEKANFCSNTFSLLHFKIRLRNFHAAKPLAFSLHFLFRRDQNHYTNLNSKTTKCVNRS